MVVRNMRSGDAKQLERLQEIVFPTLAKDELIRAEHYLRHLELFPQGQFVITDKNDVIGMTSSMRSKFDFNSYNHTFKEVMAGGWMSNHDPDGDWLYGLDIGIHPDYRGRGLARHLYRARQHIARLLKLKGQVTVGMMSGYGIVSDKMSGEEYFNELVARKRFDPTITPQMKIGFEPIALIANYLEDIICGNYGVLIKLDINKDV